ncbi:hypothetical protein DACRYDRAFT_114745 [Dacryopinax primogenitus]|uniref:CCHC-type domain-containing protein n=1 Tax=Dacryopinax primogenitus (strain DJM 731) TaxID=1858805 RepID=M5G2H2_DACPD|nr:uncharacterized protein DACRYDRAFT_114745 [Dacryopinax primogenitus]EJU04416.1 hypothetical protein DACRYDRAFT_114745 [Dacryopinax primogenitus]
MTRYTNLGYKRTHVEATKIDGSSATSVAQDVGSHPTGANAQPKKKTHRAGKKWTEQRKRKRDADTENTDGDHDIKNDRGGGEEDGYLGGEEDADSGRYNKKRRIGAADALADGGRKPTLGSSAGAIPSMSGVDPPANAVSESGTSGQKTKAKPKKKFERKQYPKDAYSRAIASEERRIGRIADRQAQTICFACRQPGHSVRDCPDISGSAAPSNTNKVALKGEALCYRCGSTQHTLGRCRKPELPSGDLPFAKCFICGGTGHLAGQCGKNKHGVYPRGGNCKVCGEVTHLAKDCPLRWKDNQGDALVLGMTTDGKGADEDDFHELKRRKTEVDKEDLANKKVDEAPLPKPKKVVKF